MKTSKFLSLAVAAIVFSAVASAQSSELAPELARARELSELDWTPLHDIQLSGKKGKVAKALSQQHGMLYGSTKYNKVPYDISLYTFLTCLHNPYSLLYTESRNPNFPRSAYGEEYDGGKLSGPWMGCVCTIFSSYVSGFEFQYGSGAHAKLCKRGILSRPENQSAQGVEQFDILWHKGHCRVVTEVIRAEDGSVTAVEISESTPPVVIRKMYSPASFDSLMVAKEMVIYRRADVSKQGTPPVYHMPSPLEYNDAICTFAGDRACFKKGDRIIIHCLDRSFREMELYRDGTLVKKIRLKSRMLVGNEMLGIRGNLDLDPGAYAVDLTKMNLEYGKYEACLVKGSKRSKPTKFEVIDCSAYFEDGELHFSSKNAKPIFYIRGEFYYIFSQEALDNGYHKITTPSPKTRLCVTFQGEYGRVSQLVKH